MQSTEDRIFMMRCIQLAAQGIGTVAPNPMVGAILVLDGKIISEGFHQKYGEAHAEVNCIGNVPDEILSNATLYVNLEPCAHFGKTPPCATLIVKKKIKRVVVGCLDPNPQVAGKGIELLKSNGIDVLTGVCEAECRTLNKRFFTAIEKNRPFIILKYAQTTDGFIGNEPFSVTSRQISNFYSQRLTHKWRSEESGILVGTHTAINDNPQLNARLHGNRNPVRIALDKNLKIPTTHHLFNGKQPTLIINMQQLKSVATNLEYLSIDFNTGQFLRNLLTELLKNNIQSLIVEGGAITLQHFYHEALWDEARIFTSPIIWGKGIKAPQIPASAEIIQQESIDSDVLIIYKNTASL